MKKSLRYLALAALASFTFQVNAQEKPLSQQMSDQVLALSKDSTNAATNHFRPVKWSYDQGVMLEGIDGVWRNTADTKYFYYIQSCMDN